MAGQAGCNLPQDLVAGAVAQGVVDDLEAVEVQKEHPHAGAAAASARQRQLEPVEEETAIGKAGERVVLGAVLGLSGPQAHLLEAPVLGQEKLLVDVPQVP